MTGSTQEDYAKMMLAGGRSVEGNRSKTKARQVPAQSEVVQAASKPASEQEGRSNAG